VRQAAAFDFKIETVTRKAMKEASSELTKVSPERKRDELFKILEGPHPDKALRALEILTVYPHLLPELSAIKGVAQSAPHVKDVWEHTLSVIRYLDDILTVLAEGYNAENTHDTFTGMLTLRLGRYREQFIQHFKQHLNADRSLRSLLFFAALYHDVSKPATKSVDATGKIRFIGHQGQSAAIAVERAKSFNLSNDEIERLEIIITNHMRFKALTDQFETGKKELSRKAIFHFFRDAEEAGVDLILLGLADLRGTSEHNLTQSQWTSSLDAARELLENYWEKPEKTVNPPQLLDGNDIITIYSLEEGPLIGKLLHAIREAQATGKVVTRKEAVEFGFKWLETNR
jgi:tRNA nucleotidyltransferase/poly(A) polymerase